MLAIVSRSDYLILAVCFNVRNNYGQRCASRQRRMKIMAYSIVAHATRHIFSTEPWLERHG
ncbi:MAG: hypothetical protein M3367_19940 [Acidobacteriota bacterium]|nr:hypothetical protein [Acidobacteriota bacterium]